MIKETSKGNVKLESLWRFLWSFGATKVLIEFQTKLSAKLSAISSENSSENSSEYSSSAKLQTNLN
jgi:hypothetical protein